MFESIVKGTSAHIFIYGGGSTSFRIVAVGNEGYSMPSAEAAGTGKK